MSPSLCPEYCTFERWTLSFHYFLNFTGIHFDESRYCSLPVLSIPFIGMDQVGLRFLRSYTTSYDQPTTTFSSDSHQMRSHIWSASYKSMQARTCTNHCSSILQRATILLALSFSSSLVHLVPILQIHSIKLIMEIIRE